MTKLAVLKRERRKNNKVTRPHTRYVNCGTFRDFRIFPLLTTANYDTIIILYNLSLERRRTMIIKPKRDRESLKRR
jgi:hypothetical protein